MDHRADIYSLGVVFYEMLTGEVPVGNFQPPSKKVEVDVRLDDVVLRSMAREPERRYQHVSDLKTDVEAVSSNAVFDPKVENQEPATSSGLSHGERMGLLTVWFFGAMIGYKALVEIAQWVAGLGGWTEAFDSWESEIPTPLLVVLWLIGGWLL